jgi:hypothetical protein
VALKLTSKGTARFVWADDSMEAQWVLRPDDSEEELIRKMKLIIGFVEARGTPLPERIPGMALGMAQTAHPALKELVTNGWAQMAPPELPEDRKGDWEMIPPEEQG